MADRFIDAIDSDGNVVGSFTETNDTVLNWDLPAIFPSLPAGDYSLVMRTPKTTPPYEVSAAGINLAPLFANGEDGDEWVFHKDNLFTKTAVGVYEPVTTTGDLIARATGLHNTINLDQDDALKRPVYGEGGGLSWIEYDGSGQFLKSADGVLNTPVNSWFIATDMSRPNSVVLALPQDSSVKLNPYFRYLLFLRWDDDFVSRINGIEEQYNVAIPTSTYIAGIGSDRGQLRLNGTTVGSNVTTASLTYPNSVPFIVGANVDGAAVESSSGKIHGIVALGRSITNAEIDLVEQKLAYQAGVTI